mmetsp:Transcript_21430/g.61054  ORF Transcript_21430/g.61054 Transcript_21430/m.61054 type:complete len:221 (-) Transcript_21430:1284-1946(-)
MLTRHGRWTEAGRQKRGGAFFPAHHTAASPPTHPCHSHAFTHKGLLPRRVIMQTLVKRPLPSPPLPSLSPNPHTMCPQKSSDHRASKRARARDQDQDQDAYITDGAYTSVGETTVGLEVGGQPWRSLSTRQEVCSLPAARASRRCFLCALLVAFRCCRSFSSSASLTAARCLLRAMSVEEVRKATPTMAMDSTTCTPTRSPASSRMTPGNRLPSGYPTTL